MGNFCQKFCTLSAFYCCYFLAASQRRDQTLKDFTNCLKLDWSTLVHYW